VLEIKKGMEILLPAENLSQVPETSIVNKTVSVISKLGGGVLNHLDYHFIDILNTK